MNGFYREIDGIFRLRVPFENLYTSVFVIECNGRVALVDCATTAFDVDEYIVPSLDALGYRLSDLDALVLTHRHGDHAGGLPRILEYAPDLKIVCDAGELFDGVSTVSLAGHTLDSIGVIDIRTRTLISGDGLQGAGVDKYRCNVKSQEDYLETLTRIRNDERIERILLSHAYEPWYSDRIEGREAVLTCLAECKKYLKHYEGNLS